MEYADVRIPTPFILVLDGLPQGSEHTGTLKGHRAIFWGLWKYFTHYPVPSALAGLQESEKSGKQTHLARLAI